MNNQVRQEQSRETLWVVGSVLLICAVLVICWLWTHSFLEWVIAFLAVLFWAMLFKIVSLENKLQEVRLDRDNLRHLVQDQQRRLEENGIIDDE